MPFRASRSAAGAASVARSQQATALNTPTQFSYTVKEEQKYIA